MAPEISVVVSTLGNYEVLRRVLDGYSRQEAATGSFELVVVADRADPDLGAIDETIGIRTYPVRRITGRIPGLSANRNAGWRAARGELVLFTDNDTIPVRRVISEHVAWHRASPAQEVAVLGHVRWARELRVTPLMRWLERGLQFDYPSIEGIEAGWGRFWGANVSVKRAFLDRVGGFDEERLPYGYEDLDWAYRASKLGLQVLYNRRAVVDHLPLDVTLDFWQRKVRRIAVTERHFVALHPELPPWYFRMFSHAAQQPSPRQHPRLDPYVPGWLPWLGPRVRAGLDLAFKQALAPHFLAAWEEASVPPDGPVHPELSEHEGAPLGASPGGPK